jgi:PD-(D/E)XK nuclease superfamily
MRMSVAPSVMSVGQGSVRRVDLTDGQRRTLRELIGTGDGATDAVPPGAAQRARSRLDDALGGLSLADPLWLSKGRLDELDRCPGMLQASLHGERDEFAHTVQSAAGTLMHRAVQLDVAVERRADARSVVERAAERLLEQDRGFVDHWNGLDALDRAERLAEAAASLAQFREMFPPLQRGWQPVSEQSMRTRVAGGLVVLSGRLDLVLGRRQRLLIDFKGGDARPAHAEDMRFYALLCALTFGRPPYRVASVFLQSMEWQAEDVTEETLDLAAHRVIRTATAAAGLLGGSDPQLTAGRHCGWCPRQRTCPAARRHTWQETPVPVRIDAGTT